MKAHLDSLHQIHFSDTTTKCNSYSWATYMLTIVDQSHDDDRLCISFYDSLCDPLIKELAKVLNHLNYGNRMI